MADIYIRAMSINESEEILGQVFNGLNDIKRAVESLCRVERDPWFVEPKSPADGVHVVCVYEPYPCFDAEDYASEDRDYSNYFFSTKPFTMQQVKRLSKLPGRCDARMVNYDMPEWAVPAVYYPGDGDTMIVATLS